MAIKDKYEIDRKYISNPLARSRQKLVSGPEFFVAHETANNNADADDHYTYFLNITFQASAHTFIDSTKILEIIPIDEKAWHVQYQKPTDNRLFGDDANDAAIGTELCRTGSFAKAYDRYIWYHAYLCRKFDKDPRKHIVGHSKLDPQRRTDPQSWLEPHGVSWNEFIADVHHYYKNWYGEGKVKPKRDTKVKAEKVRNYLMKGDRGNDVKSLQNKLIDLGYDLGIYRADGVYGEDTVKAVKAFQRHEGIKVDGIYGVASKKAMKTAKSIKNISLPNKTYYYRSSMGLPKFHGAGVRKVQEALASVYFYPNKGAKNNGCDSWYGSDTADAVSRFQSVHGLKVDGDYGSKTRAKLIEVIRNK